MVFLLFVPESDAQNIIVWCVEYLKAVYFMVPARGTGAREDVQVPSLTPSQTHFE